MRRMSKASWDAARMAVTPTALATAQARQPAPIPTAAAMPTRRPPAADVRSTSSVSGPGVIVSRAAKSANATKLLLNRHRLCEIAWLVNIMTQRIGDLASQYLQRHRGHQRRKQRGRGGHL